MIHWKSGKRGIAIVRHVKLIFVCFFKQQFRVAPPPTKKRNEYSPQRATEVSPVNPVLENT